MSEKNRPAMMLIGEDDKSLSKKGSIGGFSINCIAWIQGADECDDWMILGVRLQLVAAWKKKRKKSFID